MSDKECKISNVVLLLPGVQECPVNVGHKCQIKSVKTQTLCHCVKECLCQCRAQTSDKECKTLTHIVSTQTKFIVGSVCS